MAIQNSGNIFGTFINSILKFFGVIIGKWKISVPLIVIVTAVLTSMGSAVNEKSLVPIIKHIGDIFFSTNHQINMESTRIINDGGIVVKDVTVQKDTFFYTSILLPLKKLWTTITSLWSLIWAVVLFIWWFVFLIWLSSYITNNQSASFGVLAVALVLYFSISSIYASYYIYPDLELQTGEKISLGEKLNPFSGIFKLVEALPYFKPIYQPFITEKNNNANIVALGG